MRNPYFQIIILSIAALFFLIKLKKDPRLLILLSVFFIWGTQIEEHDVVLKKEDEYRILSIHSAYTIAKNDKQKVIVYALDDVHIDDVVFIKGKISKISSLKNDHLFRFDKYAKRQQIKYAIKAESFRVINAASSLKGKLYTYFDTHPLSFIYKAIFYRIHELDTMFVYMLFASGMHILELARRLAKAMHINRELCSIGVCVVYTMLFPMRYFIYQILCISIVAYLFNSMHKKDQLGFCMLILMVLNPNHIYELGFILYFGLWIVREFVVIKENQKIAQCLFLMGIQLLLFNQVSLFMVLGFMLLRRFVFHVFLFALLAMGIAFLHNELVMMYGFCLHLLNILATYDVMLQGFPHLLWLIVWLYSLVYISKHASYKKYILVMFLLLYQCSMRNMMLFGKIVFIDVGQGDCILIVEPLRGKTILIDAAGAFARNLAEEVIYPVLKAHGVRALDAVVITHEDFDHDGSLSDLKELIPIRVVYHQLSKLKLDGIVLQNLNLKSHSEENDNSMVLFASIYGKNYMFMGDAPKHVEQSILQNYPHLKVDVIKIGHHGSNTSSDSAFISSINPQLAILSLGENNRYGHPHKSVLATLDRFEVYILRTDKQGSISIYFSHYLHFFKTEDKVFGIIK